MRSTINLWQQDGCNHGENIIFNLIKTLYRALAPCPFTGRQRYLLLWTFKVVLSSTWLCRLGIIVQDGKFLFPVYYINLRLILFHLPMSVQVFCQIIVTFYVWILFDLYISVYSLFIISHTKSFYTTFKILFLEILQLCIYMYSVKRSYFFKNQWFYCILI
jgi:hypothetical protein